MYAALDFVSLKSKIDIPVATMMDVILGKEDGSHIHACCSSNVLG